MSVQSSTPRSFIDGPSIGTTITPITFKGLFARRRFFIIRSPPIWLNACILTYAKSFRRFFDVIDSGRVFVKPNFLSFGFFFWYSIICSSRWNFLGGYSGSTLLFFNKFRNNYVSWETGVCGSGTVCLSICLGFLVSLGDHRSRLSPSRLTLVAWILSLDVHPFGLPLFSFAITEMSI